jgi:hypothetical protein
VSILGTEYFPGMGALPILQAQTGDISHRSNNPAGGSSGMNTDSCIFCYIQRKYQEMKEEGISQEKIANELGVTRRTVYNWRQKGNLDNQ